MSSEDLSPQIGAHVVDLARRYRLSVFPDHAEDDAVVVNLDALARGLRPRTGTRSPLLDADVLDRLLSRLHRRWKAAYSLGGYLEDRRTLWRGSYLTDETALHLGIDINLPAQTAICLAHDATLVHVTHDPCQDGGWGGVAIFKLDRPLGAITHALYAHLARDSLRWQVGARVSAGETVAHLGVCSENGGWYEHLHVQALTQQAWDDTHGDLARFDGYAPIRFAQGHPLFPDPWPLLGAREIAKNSVG